MINGSVSRFPLVAAFLQLLALAIVLEPVQWVQQAEKEEELSTDSLKFNQERTENQ